MDASEWGVLFGSGGAGISVLSLAVGQYNRWRSKRDKAQNRHEDELISQPDHAVKRLAVALDNLAKENDRLTKMVEGVQDDNARLRTELHQLMMDHDRAIGENRELRQEVADLRYQVQRGHL